VRSWLLYGFLLGLGVAALWPGYPGSQAVRSVTGGVYGTLHSGAGQLA
jgi:hypothetical protein